MNYLAFKIGLWSRLSSSSPLLFCWYSACQIKIEHFPLRDPRHTIGFRTSNTDCIILGSWVPCWTPDSISYMHPSVRGVYHLPAGVSGGSGFSGPTPWHGPRTPTSSTSSPPATGSESRLPLRSMGMWAWVSSCLRRRASIPNTGGTPCTGCNDLAMLYKGGAWMSSQLPGKRVWIAATP